MSMKAAEAREILALLRESQTVTMLVPDLAVAQVKKAISLAKARSTLRGRINFHEEPSHQEGLTSLSMTLLFKPSPYQITSTGVPTNE